MSTAAVRRPESTQPPVPPLKTADSDAAKGVALGLLAAVGYSVANLALRQLAKGQGGFFWDVWISGMKALPTFLAAAVLLAMNISKGRTTFPAWSAFRPLIGAALLMQFGGNLGFQLALREIGLAITVPIVFSSIIVSGAIVGRIVVGDAVSVRTAISMGLMVASIGFLSAAAHTGGGSVDPSKSSASFGIAIALVSGVSYGLCGVVIRRVVQSKLPIEVTLLAFSVTGLLTLCPISAANLGISGLRAISGQDWWTMIAAGTFNAVGFFAITHALRFLTISRANVVNASQNAMCAVGAFVFFAEPLTSVTLAGIGLTIVGLLILDRK
ncbi:MAG: DMT family transporter [Planctomycetaceae bacterium]